ncbi:MAG: hypothetical protein JNL21_28455 [Myxococcales bacterium]|nr:hypothetical protein [Myxococcales bacterium]
MTRVVRYVLAGSFVLTSCLIGACGGSVVFVEDDDGAGGTGTTTTGSPTSTGKGPTTGVTTGLGSGPTSGVTTGGPLPVCQIGPVSGLCEECAAGACQLAQSACSNDIECVDYADCIFSCGGGGACCDECVAKLPIGATLYTDLVRCVVCEACPGPCQGAAPGLCN